MVIEGIHAKGLWNKCHFKKKNMEWLAILQWKMMVHNNLIKERPVAFSLKENTFFHLKKKKKKTQVNCGN